MNLYAFKLVRTMSDNNPIYQPPPTRHVLFEKTMDKKVSCDKYLLSPNGCIWKVDFAQCSISQLIYQKDENGNYGRNVKLYDVNNNQMLTYKKSDIIERIDTGKSYGYFGKKQTSFHSSFIDAEKLLCNFVIPIRIDYLKKRIFQSKNLSSNRREKAKIQIVNLNKKLKKLRRKLTA